MTDIKRNAMKIKKDIIKLIKKEPKSIVTAENIKVISTNTSLINIPVFSFFKYANLVGIKASTNTFIPFIRDVFDSGDNFFYIPIAFEPGVEYDISQLSTNRLDYITVDLNFNK